MKPRIFLDEDVPLELGRALRKRGFDALHAQEVERKGRSDEEQLSYAVREERCFVSFNVKDFVLIHNEYVKAGNHHFGIVVGRQRPIGETMRRLLRLLGRDPCDSLENRLEFL